jgi:hypothetical protein
VYIYTLLTPEQLNGFYLYSVFKILSIIDPCPVNLNILAPKIGALQIRALRKQNGKFLGNGP